MIMTTGVSKTKRKERRKEERKKERKKKRKVEGNDTGVIGKEVREKCRGSLKGKGGLKKARNGRSEGR